MAEWFAKKGWDFAQKQDTLSRPFNISVPEKPARRIRHPTSNIGKRRYSTPAQRLPDSQSVALLTGDVENFPSKLKQLHEQLLSFMEKEIYPIEEGLFQHQKSENRWIPHFEIERLKVDISLSLSPPPPPPPPPLTPALSILILPLPLD